MKLNALKAATSLHDVAYLLGYKPKALAYVLYKKPKAAKYTQFEILKRSGGVRPISAPYPQLKHLQARLSEFLQDCVDEINYTKGITSAISHGFRRNYSIMTNAAVHRGKRYVFNTDLEDFFGTINFGRVRGFFIANKNFLLSPKAATVLAQIACHDNALPQGSPCSPVISNLIGHILDIRLAKLAFEEGCDYTRYADDLSFSTNKRVFPAAIASRRAKRNHEWTAGRVLARIVRRSGFSINEAKSRLQYSDSRQEVTGLVANVRVNTRAEYRRMARAMADKLFQTGSFYLRQLQRDALGKVALTDVPGTVDQLNGILSFINSANAFELQRAGRKERQDKRRLSAADATYGTFLFYKYFYANPRPLILCEGKTDGIYIKAAIRQLSRKKLFASLVGIHIFRYSTATDRLLGLGGGTPQLSQFISSYPHNCAGFGAPSGKQPVVMLIDSDDGAEGIYGALKNVTKAKAKVDGKGPHYFVTNNLYIVPTPFKKGKGTTIETFFEASVKKTKLNGKSFNPGKEPKPNEYGKATFAEHVIAKNQDKISFDGFREILSRIEGVIADYKLKVGP
jgi:hypothetical protein